MNEYYSTYSGAPDECSRHWPEKLKDCRSCAEEAAGEDERLTKIAETIRVLTPWIQSLRGSA